MWRDQNIILFLLHTSPNAISLFYKRMHSGVNVSGAPAQPHLQVCCVHMEEVLVLVPPSHHMPHTTVPHKQAVAVHPPHLHPPPSPPHGDHYTIFFIHKFLLLYSSPHLEVSSLFVWLLGGTSVCLSSGGLMGVFQKRLFYIICHGFFSNKSFFYHVATTERKKGENAL